MTRAEKFSDWATSLVSDDLPEAVVHQAARSMLDVVGLALSARREDYVSALLASHPAEGNGTAFGHATGLAPQDAALVNGVAGHGEDYDDTFEGTPVHTGVVVVPAVLAACEARGLSAERARLGIAAGGELMCRLAVVAPTAIHRAGFHPTGVAGALAAAAAVSVAIGLDGERMSRALGIAGSMASGIIEYLADGSSTKRLHAGWAAHCGYRAALFAENGFTGPKSVIEGEHGFFLGFAKPGIDRDFGQIDRGLGRNWLYASIAFKPYACGTMTQPFVDCAIALRNKGVTPDQVARIECKCGEGTVHRLWEPLASKQKPATPYAAKFSTPYCVAAGLVDGAAGLAQFTDERIANADLLHIAGLTRYEIDPKDPYPASYRGHVRATLKDGSTVEAIQPHMRGGATEPLTDDELKTKFTANVQFGGYSAAQADHLYNHASGVLRGDAVIDLAPFAQQP
ncbi:MmgE/PrpD family protein [Alphaproteobacteria bacterium HT1-32]|nr:MmgE/PrpD family protein [Alphaproteobacteria bacterium HT1-32]